ncbi:MAG TPA: hypothetical protein PLG50_10055 [bacterium]|nr:hypothetical protein [bacterium]HQG45992.1 hypothetical protein [bacterium]HQI47366.1 hypothetical protein [bacterium]HQJ63032.1 hypothetical protein [bacterium]
MANQFVETVFAGDDRFIRGFLQGWLAGSGKVYRFFLHGEAGITGESLGEKLKELAGIGEEHAKVLIEVPFWECLKADAVAVSHLGWSGKFSGARTVKSAQFYLKIKDASREDAQALKEIIRNRPDTLQVEGWKEEEKVNQGARGIELYAPLHEYLYSASGSFSGPIDLLIDLRQKLLSHSSAIAEGIRILYE